MGAPGPPDIVGLSLEIIGFRNWGGGPVGHPQGAQVKTLIFNIKYLPKVSHVDLVAILPRNKNLDLGFGFRSFSGQTWPRDPLQRVRFEKWCRTPLKLAQGTNYQVISWPFPGLGKKLKFEIVE